MLPDSTVYSAFWYLYGPHPYYIYIYVIDSKGWGFLYATSACDWKYLNFQCNN